MVAKKLTPSDAKHIASLANLSIRESELAKLTSDLSNILDLVNKLQKLDTKNVEPTSQVTGLTNVYRDDVVRVSLTQTEALSDARKTHNGYFVVPAIFEE